MPPPLTEAAPPAPLLWAAHACRRGQGGPGVPPMGGQRQGNKFGPCTWHRYGRLLSFPHPLTPSLPSFSSAALFPAGESGGVRKFQNLPDRAVSSAPRQTSHFQSRDVMPRCQVSTNELTCSQWFRKPVKISKPNIVTKALSSKATQATTGPASSTEPRNQLSSPV